MHLLCARTTLSTLPGQGLHLLLLLCPRAARCTFWGRGHGPHHTAVTHKTRHQVGCSERASEITKLPGSQAWHGCHPAASCQGLHQRKSAQWSRQAPRVPNLCKLPAVPISLSLPQSQRTPRGPGRPHCWAPAHLPSAETKSWLPTRAHSHPQHSPTHAHAHARTLTH